VGGFNQSEKLVKFVKVKVLSRFYEEFTFNFKGLKDYLIFTTDQGTIGAIITISEKIYMDLKKIE